MVCFVFDLISFFVFVGIAGNLKRSAGNILAKVEGDQIPSTYELEQQKSLISLFQLYLVIVYVFLDFSFLYWVAHWFFKLPVPLNKSVPMALVGLGSRLREGFGMVPQVTTQAQGQKRSEGPSFGGNKAPKTKLPK